MKDAKGYKICDDLKDISPQIIREWNRETTGDLILVKRQVFFRCPRTDILVPESDCHNCPHNFGDASKREIYCMPNTKKTQGVRGQRKKPIL